MPTPPAPIDPRAEARFRQALNLHIQGQVGRAQSLYREALQLQPDHTEALHHLGIVALQSRDPATAMQLIGRAVALNPANPAAHSNLGMACEDAGQPEAALASYDRAITLKPDYAEAILNRGSGEREAAVELATRTLQAVRPMTRAARLLGAGAEGVLRMPADEVAP